MDEQRAPYHELHFYVSQTLQRLVATDIRALNRRLRRTFDIFELSSMSNSIIENILVDIDALGTRFLWVQEEWEESPKESSSTFYLVLHLFQMLLQAMGQLRATMNELQVEYVSKVEEYRQRVEEEMDQKRETMDQKALLKSSPFSPTSRTPPAGPLSWISHVFQRKGHPHQHIMTSPRMGRSISYESIVPRYTHDPAMTVAKAPKTSTRNMGHHDLAEEQQRPKTAGFEKDRQSGKVDIRRVKSSICQYGPVSCYSRSVVSGDKATPRIPYPIVRASKSTGTDRNARQVSSLGREAIGIRAQW
ncbi:hypothetical protein BDF14DRAFT_1350354 [Spinellus fusiger]|nr:hypothetical protein BDF14DRAFT_1350354 [Spinellus fusiger]